eukprot:6213390-Pleurochrysis_carterae.AAC.5
MKRSRENRRVFTRHRVPCEPLSAAPLTGRAIGSTARGRVGGREQVCARASGGGAGGADRHLRRALRVRGRLHARE